MLVACIVFSVLFPEALSQALCAFVTHFTGIYSVELVNDSLYEWHVKLRT